MVCRQDRSGVEAVHGDKMRTTHIDIELPSDGKDHHVRIKIGVDGSPPAAVVPGNLINNARHVTSPVVKRLAASPTAKAQGTFVRIWRRVTGGTGP